MSDSIETAVCEGCDKEIFHSTFRLAPGAGPEPDYNPRDDPKVWRHRGGYAAGGSGFARPSDRPEVVCLCGSTRFYDEFQRANYDLTMAGKIVLTVGFYPHSSTHGEGVGHDSPEKVALDELHKRKIDLADRVFVLNVDGYIGDSTRSEIDYAVEHGVPVDYLEAIEG